MDYRSNDPNEQFDPGFDRTRDRTTGEGAGSKVRRAADAAFRDHDEPADTGDRVGEVTGGVTGAATGAALGSLGGPIGTIIGGIAGAVGGWWTGRAVSEAAESFTDQDDAYYRSQFEGQRRGSLSDDVSGDFSGSPAGAGGVSGVSDAGGAGSAEIDRNFDDYDRARPAYQLGYLAGMNPDYHGRAFEDVEPDLQRGWGNSAYADDDWSGVRDYARDAFARGQERRLTLSAEQLAIGKRQVRAGEVEVRKTVETEHVSERVPVVREEVTVERRPLAAADVNAADAHIGEQEIRVPLMEEEVVVDKRVVPVEEVVVKKHAVTEERTVADDLRRERLVTDGLDDADARSRSRETLRDGARDDVRDDVRDELR